MKLFKFFILTLIFSLGIWSCKPKSQAAQKLDSTSREFFEIPNGTEYVFTDYFDTTKNYIYKIQNFINNQANQDIENNEIMSYDIICNGREKLTLRAESGGAQFMDRIALLIHKNDSIKVGPVFYNLTGILQNPTNPFDSFAHYPVYTINGKVFEGVAKVKTTNNLFFTQLFFAKNIGLIRKDHTDGRIEYVKSFKKP